MKTPTLYCGSDNSSNNAIHVFNKGVTMIYIRAIAVLLMTASPLAFSDALDVSLNNNAVAFKYGASAAGLIQGNADIRLGALYNGNSMNSLGEAGLLVKADDGDSQEATLAVGVKALTGVIKDAIPNTTLNVGAVVVGGELSYAFPAAKQLSAAFYFFTSPKIITFGDSNRANQWGMHLDYEVSPGTKVYVEYREANFGITSTGKTAMLDGGTYMGINAAF
jgi:predicted porin